MDLISTQEAADQKGTSPQIIRAAISRGEIDSVKVGGPNLIKPNKKFKEWERSKRPIGCHTRFHTKQRRLK